MKGDKLKIVDDTGETIIQYNIDKRKGKDSTKAPLESWYWIMCCSKFVRNTRKGSSVSPTPTSSAAALV